MRKIAIIGLGKIGILHAGIVNALEDTSLTAICENESFLLRAAKPFLPEKVAFYRDYMKMLDSEQLDAVFVTTPIDTHSSLVSDIARANRDLSIFVEKPLAATYEQARVACEAARSLRGIHMVGFQKRFSPVFKKAKEFIDNKSLGDLLFFRAYSFSSDVFQEGGSWRFRKGSGGVLLDLAPHLLDILLWFFGEPVGIESLKRHFWSLEVDDYVHAVMSFESGLKGHMDACWSIKNFRLPEMSIEVYGKNGLLTVTDDFVKLALGREIGRSQMYYKQAFDTSVRFLLADPEYTLEDEAFLGGVQNGELPDSNFFEAAKVNATIDRISEGSRRAE